MGTVICPHFITLPFGSALRALELQIWNGEIIAIIYYARIHKRKTGFHIARTIKLFAHTATGKLSQRSTLAFYLLSFAPCNI
jgi:hypothetical protein